MKHLLFILSLFVAITSFAQIQGELVIIDVKGSVVLQNGKDRIPLKANQRIDFNNIILLEDNAIAILVEESANKRYMLKGAYAGSVRNYIQRNEKSCVKGITNTYMKYLLTKAHGHHKPKESAENGHATIFREGDILSDSITLSVKSMDSLYHVFDTLYHTIDSLSDVHKKMTPPNLPSKGKKTPLN